MKKGKEKKLIYRPAGDTALLIDFGREIDPLVNAEARAMARAIQNARILGVEEIIPTYRSVMVIYDPLKILPEQLISFVEQAKDDLDETHDTPGRVVEIPVCYGGEFGPDMETVQKSAGLGREEVIQIHSQPEYLIYMVGFTPGFPFLGGLDERLFTPRLKTPRVLVPEGSVGIANNQTGVYPLASPGGWQLIGRTPLTLFRPLQENPFLYQAGDKIKFNPITLREYDRLKQA